jgi:hypothetical protein
MMSAIALLVWQELDHDIVGDHAHRELVHHRHLAVQGFRRRRPGAGGERCDHRRDETGAPGAERGEIYGERGATVADIEQHR